MEIKGNRGPELSIKHTMLYLKVQKCFKINSLIVNIGSNPIGQKVGPTIISDGLSQVCGKFSCSQIHVDI